MTNNLKTLAKGGIATAALGAMALAGATPAMARDNDGNGISAGDVIAGAVIIGGIAAIASAVSKGDRSNGYGYSDDYRDRDRSGYGYRDRWQSRGNPRGAVERCITAVERDARRAGYRFADVTQIRSVEDTRYGWRVRGNLVVEAGRHAGWGGYNRYDRDDRGDRRGWGYNRSDAGRFDCRIERGRVDYIDYSGVRGLR
jgi:hypothetical protein